MSNAALNKIVEHIYLNEIWSITECILRSQSELEKFLIDNELHEGNKMHSEAEPHKIISSVLGHSARIQKIIHANSQTESETKTDFSARKKRAEYLTKLLKAKGLSEIRKAKVRNAIEHFDDRLDKISSAIERRDERINNLTLLLHLTIKTTAIFEGDGWSRILPVKVFVVDENKYYMPDENLLPQSIDLKKLFEENIKLNSMVKSVVDPKSTLSGPCGILKAHPHSKLPIGLSWNS